MATPIPLTYFSPGDAAELALGTWLRQQTFVTLFSFFFVIVGAGNARIPNTYIFAFARLSPRPVWDHICAVTQ